MARASVPCGGCAVLVLMLVCCASAYASVPCVQYNKCCASASAYASAVHYNKCCASSFCDIGRYSAKPHTALGVGAELPFPNTWETVCFKQIIQSLLETQIWRIIYVNFLSLCG